MARSQLRAWAVLAVVLLASASALGQNAPANNNAAPESSIASPPASPSPASSHIDPAPTPSEAVLPTSPDAAPVAADPAVVPLAATPAAAPTSSTPAAAPVTPTPAAAPVTSTPAAAPVVATPAAAPVTSTPAAAPVAATPAAAPITSTPAAAPVAATPAAVPADTTPTVVPLAATPAVTHSTTPTTTTETSSTPVATVTNTVQEGEDHTAGVPSAKAEEDPCKAIPGCSACIAPTPSKSRKLMRSTSMDGLTAAGKPTLDWTSLIKSPYDDPNIAKCTACTGKGYLQGTNGRCNCAPGYGDIYPTGHCNLCPEGYISRGGFRAVCEECTNVAWSNPEHTLCVCASGWYGYTNTVTRQATCNQCPGTRPLSKDGSRSAAECFACPAGQQPNEIFSECVTPANGPAAPPPPTTLGDLISSPPPSPAPAPPAPALYNQSTFADAKEDWKIITRASENVTNPITDLIGNVVESMIMGRNVSSNAQQPGDLIYQVLTKPPPSTQETLKNLQNIAALGAGLGAAAGALPAVAKAVGTDTPLGGLINGVAQGMGSLASNMRQGAPGIPQIPAIPAAGSGGNSLELVTNILGQVLKNPPKVSGGSSQASPLDSLKTLTSIAKLAGALRPAAPAPSSAAPVVGGIANAVKLMNVPKTASGFVQVPAAPPKVASAVNPLKLLSSKSH